MGINQKVFSAEVLGTFLLLSLLTGDLILILNATTDFSFQLTILTINLTVVGGLIYLISRERRQYKAALRESANRVSQSEKLVSLGVMSAGVAHEINNPLAIIKGKAEMTLAFIDREGCQKERVVKMAGDVIRATDRIVSIVEALKFYTRLNKGKGSGRVSVNDVISRSVESTEELAKEQGVELKVAFLPEDVIIPGQSQLLQQAVLNLIQNAVDAVKEAESPWVKVEVFQPEVARGELESIEVHVTDSGEGIPAEVREQMMNPFFTTKAIGQGTGLGMSLVSGIVESHSGYIFYNENSKSTQFVISLPLLRISKTKPEPSKSSGSGSQAA